MVMETNFMQEQVEHNPEFNKWWQEWLCAIAKRRGELVSAPDPPACGSTICDIDYPAAPPRSDRVM